MPHPAPSFRPVWFSGLLTAAMALITICSLAAHAAEQCATEPNFKAAQGSHWYYRIDRASQRKCWFVARTEMRVKPSAPAKAQSARKSPLPTAETTKGQQISTNGGRWLEVPIAAAQNPDPAQAAAAVVPESLPEPAADVQLEASFAGEAPAIWPVLAASEPEPAEAPAGLPVEPVHLIAILAAALGLAAVAGRLILKYCVVFSA